MKQLRAGAYIGGLVLALVLAADNPHRRAGAWRTLGRALDAGAWHIWRGANRAHARYADIMMDTAQKGRP